GGPAEDVAPEGEREDVEVAVSDAGHTEDQGAAGALYSAGGIHSPECTPPAYGCTRHGTLRNPLLRPLRTSRRRALAHRRRFAASGRRSRPGDGRPGRERHRVPRAPLRPPAVLPH